MNSSRHPWKDLNQARDAVEKLVRKAWGGLNIPTVISGPTIEDAEVLFTGGLWGPHSIKLAYSSPERIWGHFEGYVSQHGVLTPKAGETVDYYAAGILRSAKVVRSTARRSLVAFVYNNGRRCTRWVSNSQITFRRVVTRTSARAS